jgi:hypothetical protein
VESECLTLVLFFMFLIYTINDHFFCVIFFLESLFFCGDYYFFSYGFFLCLNFVKLFNQFFFEQLSQNGN